MQLTACLEYIREGNVLIVTRLDRLARSTLHLCEIAQLLEEKRNTNTFKGNERAIAAVIARLKDEHSDVRETAVTALGQIVEYPWE
tara:strand:- start:161 stop:418 length:258 start_codon:yes stop_codon:yes gene_type:complete